MAKKQKKASAPRVRIERGERLPVADFQNERLAERMEDDLLAAPPFYYPLHYRLPARLRTPEGSDPESIRSMRNEAYETAEQRWQEAVPRSLADRYLSAAWSGKRLVPEIMEEGKGAWLTVRGVGTPSRWTPDKKKAWSNFEKALSQSLVAAEKDYHGEIARRLSEQREAEKARRAREREEAASERVRLAAQREREQEAAAEEIRKKEHARLVAQYGEEGAAFRQALASPSRHPVVQAHRRRLAREAEERARRGDSRFDVLETDPLTPPAQAARARLVDALRAQFARAVDPREQRQILARLRRAEAGALRKGSVKDRAAWEERERRESERIGRRFRKLEFDEGVVPPLESPSRVSPSRVSPSRVSPRDVRSVEEQVSSPRGRYVSPTAALPTLPLEVAESMDAEARARAEREAGPAPEYGARAWRKKLDDAYAEIKRALWLETAARLAEEAERAARQAAEKADRFTILEID